MKCISTTVIAVLLLMGWTSTADFIDNGDGTVTDRAAELMWQQGEGGLRRWRDAVAYCAALCLAGHDDWRLPTIEELSLLADESLGYPKVDTHFFPDFPATHVNYWSSDETGGDALRARGFVFTVCTGSDFLKSDKYRVRCVRNE